MRKTGIGLVCGLEMESRDAINEKEGGGCIASDS
jgi:hypothetical protein